MNYLNEQIQGTLEFKACKHLGASSQVSQVKEGLDETGRFCYTNPGVQAGSFYVNCYWSL